MVDRGQDSKRKTKRDKKAKGHYNKFKKGGRHRSSKIDISNNKNA